VNKGDTVAMLLPNGLEALEVFWACAKIGAVVVTLGAQLDDDALLSCLSLSKSSMLVTQSGFVARVIRLKPQLSFISHDRYLLTDGRLTGFRDFQSLKSAADAWEPEGQPVTDSDPCDITCSLGPGVSAMTVFTHGTRAACGTSFSSRLSVIPDSILLNGGGIPFEASLVGLMPVVFCGATYVLLPRFEPAACMESIAGEKATHLMLMSHQVEALLGASPGPTATPSALAILKIESPATGEPQKQNALAPAGRLSLVFGFAGGFFTVLAAQDQVRKPNCTGVPLPFHEVKIVGQNGNEAAAGEVGEIRGRGPMVVAGHCTTSEPAGATQNGWSSLGALGYVDEDGFLYPVRRAAARC
jgi:acyl-CoA synthetase (AMP-forming)/AMP-acid ligase II